ncbi:MAG: ribosome-associated heat shock protein Hsp15 [bacterium P3]|nr:MAG: ribosome-associated heat shock protein Hsp15 [bacterium P3]KWW42185.1 MAG: ribosome-associated heat shock protein Hsp15 [bacterium F083]
MSSGNNSRIDKFLWSVRLFKTRALAAEACRAGRVKMNNLVLKASHEVKIGEVYIIAVDHIHRQVQVKALPAGRIGAQLVEQYIVDLTPADEYSRMSAIRQSGFESRDRGAGRPTKRDRRDIERLKQHIG